MGRVHMYMYVNLIEKSESGVDEVILHIDSDYIGINLLMAAVYSSYTIEKGRTY